MNKSSLTDIPIDLLQLVDQVRDVARHGGEFIKSEFGRVKDSDVQIKDINSLVSYVDLNTERLLVTRLSQLLPQAGFITEEDTQEALESDFQWIIDPLDGTTNYLKGIPQFSVSIALSYQDSVILGVVLDVMNDWCFHAVRDEGAFLDGKRITVSHENDFSKCILATGFPYQPLETDSAIFDILKEVIQRSRGIRRMGSAAIDLAYVACGKFDGFYETTLNVWDIAAGILLVEEAGGVVSDYAGDIKMMERGSIIAASPMVYEEIIEIIGASSYVH